MVYSSTRKDNCIGGLSMNNTVVEKTEARQDKDKEWTISNEDGHFLRVTFSVAL